MVSAAGSADAFSPFSCASRSSVEAAPEPISGPGGCGSGTLGGDGSGSIGGCGSGVWGGDGSGSSGGSGSGMRGGCGTISGAGVSAFGSGLLRRADLRCDVRSQPSDSRAQLVGLVDQPADRALGAIDLLAGLAARGADDALGLVARVGLDLGRLALGRLDDAADAVRGRLGERRRCAVA